MLRFQALATLATPDLFQIDRGIAGQAAADFRTRGVEKSHALATHKTPVNLHDARRKQALSSSAKRLDRAVVDHQRALWLAGVGDPVFARR